MVVGLAWGVSLNVPQVCLGKTDSGVLRGPPYLYKLLPFRF